MTSVSLPLWKIEPLADQLVAQLAGVHQVAVVPDRDLPVGAIDQKRLRVLELALAGGRVAGVADGEVAGQRTERLLAECVGDLAHRARDAQLVAVGRGNAGALLAPVLQRVQAEIREVGRLRMAENAEDTALVFKGHSLGPPVLAFVAAPVYDLRRQLVAFARTSLLAFARAVGARLCGCTSGHLAARSLPPVSMRSGGRVAPLVYAARPAKYRPSAFVQRCSASSSEHDSSGVPAIEITIRGPPVRPILAAGTPSSAAIDISRPTCSGFTDTTARDADSPNNVAAALPAAAASDLESDAAGIEGALGQRDGEAAVRAIVRRLQQPFARGAHQQRDERALLRQIQRRRLSLHEPVQRPAGTRCRPARRGSRPARRSRRRPA